MQMKIDLNFPGRHENISNGWGKHNFYSSEGLHFYFNALITNST